MSRATTSQEARDVTHRDDADDSDRYVATFTDDEVQEHAAAEAAIDIAILLHRVREHRGLNQGAAAKLAGLHQQAVSRFERPRPIRISRRCGRISAPWATGWS